MRKDDDTIEPAKTHGDLNEFKRLIFVFKKIKKSLIMTEWAPPMVGGGPTVLRSLLKHFNHGSYSIVMKSIAEHCGRKDEKI